MMIWAALCGQHVLAEIPHKYMPDASIYNHPDTRDNFDSNSIIINSNKAYANYPESVLFSGNVNIKQGRSALDANQVELNQMRSGHPDAVRTVTATGDVHYVDTLLRLSGLRGWLNLNTRDVIIYKGTYQAVGHQGRGSANKMQIFGVNCLAIMEDATFTSCLPGDDSWTIIGSKVIHNHIGGLVEIWNARLRIRGIPVFYSPYIQFPIGDKRRSGFLIPNFKYGSNNHGIEFILPYYWNIAPNYDATLTPHYMSRHGLQWQNEFRYLTHHGSGSMEVDWLPKDKAYKRDSADNNTRWLFYWKHSGLIDRAWRFNIDFIKVSDTKYFTDLDSRHGSTSDSYAAQKLSFSYDNEYLNATLSSKKFQIFDNTDRFESNSYKIQPQVDINYYKKHLGPFDFNLFSQIAKFNSINPYNPDATRWHLEPTLNLSLTNSWVALSTEGKILASHYQQSVPSQFSKHYASRNRVNHSKNLIPNLDNSVNRILPQIKADIKLIFERPISWSKGADQILEARTQYLYVPYRDQKNIYTYDTTLLQSDYYGLFRDRIYSGLDRISSQNRVSSGFTTRIYDAALVERFNASAGQIYYFGPSNSGDGRRIYDNKDYTGNAVWIGNIYWNIDDRWILHGSLQYDTHLNSVSRGNSVLEYRQGPDRILQLNYRYAAPEYVREALNITQTFNYNKGVNRSIDQIGMTTKLPITNSWDMVWAYYYDARARKVADQLLGINYKTCCWALTLGYERKITDWNTGNNTSIYDDKVSFNIELRGLRSDYNLGASDMKRPGIPPYQYGL